MYATVRKYSDTGLADALEAAQADIKKLISEIDGFRAYYLIRTTDGGSVSVSVYDDEAGAEESNNLARKWIGENLPDLQVSAPEISAGEVIISA
jgi:heme-degrading monooxygenase HmoA